MERLLDKPISTLPAGTMFTRAAMEFIRQGGDPFAAAESAERKWKAMPQIAQGFRYAAGIEKAAVTPGTTTDEVWAAPLSVAGVAADFVGTLYSNSVLGRIAELGRRVPFNVNLPRWAALPSAYWVGESLAKPLSEAALELTDALPPRKGVSIVLLSRELILMSTPDAERAARDALIATMTRFGDAALLDPTAAGDSVTTPASLTHGAVDVPSSGSTAAAVSADIGLMFDAIATELAAPIFVAKPAIAVRLATLGATDSGSAGKTIAGVPLVRSTAAPANALVLLDASEVLVADDGGIRIDMATHASLQFVDNPSSTAANAVSLWQHGLVALKCERIMNWAMARTGAAAILSGLFAG